MSAQSLLLQKICLRVFPVAKYGGKLLGSSAVFKLSNNLRTDYGLGEFASEMIPQLKEYKSIVIWAGGLRSVTDVGVEALAASLMKLTLLNEVSISLYGTAMTNYGVAELY